MTTTDLITRWRKLADSWLAATFPLGDPLRDNAETRAQLYRDCADELEQVAALDHASTSEQPEPEASASGDQFSPHHPRYVISGEFCGSEWSEDVLPLAQAAGLCCRVKYDPQIHGDDIEAEPGVEIWWWGEELLPSNVARCDGVGSDDPEEGWREGCETCLRRTAPRSEHVAMIEPPPIIAFECEYLIEPNNQSLARRVSGSE